MQKKGFVKLIGTLTLCRYNDGKLMRTARQSTMRNIWSALVTAPTFADEDQTRNVRLAHIVIISTLFTSIISIVITYILKPVHVDLTLNFGTLLLQLIFLYLVKKGYVKPVILTFSVISWLVITDAAQMIDGLVNPIVALYVIPILFTGLLVSIRAGVAFAAISIITSLAFVVAAQAGLYPQGDGHIELGTRFANYISLFAFTGVTVYLSVGTIQNALAH